MSLSQDVPPLRPWLFRIAHNAAIDFLKSHGNKYTEAHGDIEALAGFEDKPDPAVVRAALARFLVLPVTQRSAVILLEFEDGRVKSIRDFRYVPYIAAEAAFELLPP